MISAYLFINLSLQERLSPPPYYVLQVKQYLKIFVPKEKISTSICIFLLLNVHIFNI